MCGIVGFWGATSSFELAERMASCLHHRGPDDDGAWNEDGAPTLAFRRLSILDLSPTGHQPMISASGRFAIVFNGEIYNFAALRDELSRCGTSFRGHSDTEVLLAAFEKWGVRGGVERAHGMFALALYDRERRELHLIRDRLGEKPLYYGVMGDTLVFGSELKALRAHPGWNAEIDRGALALFLRHNYVPAPYSIYRGVRKVVPGTMVTFRAGTFDAVDGFG